MKLILIVYKTNKRTKKKTLKQFNGLTLNMKNILIGGINNWTCVATAKMENAEQSKWICYKTFQSTSMIKR